MEKENRLSIAELEQQYGTFYAIVLEGELYRDHNQDEAGGQMQEREDNHSDVCAKLQAAYNAMRGEFPDNLVSGSEAYAQAVELDGDYLWALATLSNQKWPFVVGYDLQFLHRATELTSNANLINWYFEILNEWVNRMAQGRKVHIPRQFENYQDLVADLTYDFEVLSGGSSEIEQRFQIGALSPQCVVLARDALDTLAALTDYPKYTTWHADAVELGSE